MATKIKTFEQACKVTGDDPNKLPDVSGLSEAMGKAVIALIKLETIRKAINGKWIEDYSNSSQWKYFPWLVWVPSRSAFVCTNALYSYTSTYLGSRFCFETRDTARYFGEQFIDLINDFMAPNKLNANGNKS